MEGLSLPILRDRAVVEAEIESLPETKGFFHLALVLTALRTALCRVPQASEKLKIVILSHFQHLVPAASVGNKSCSDHLLTMYKEKYIFL